MMDGHLHGSDVLFPEPNDISNTSYILGPQSTNGSSEVPENYQHNFDSKEVASKTDNSSTKAPKLLGHNIVYTPVRNENISNSISNGESSRAPRCLPKSDDLIYKGFDTSVIVKGHIKDENQNHHEVRYFQSLHPSQDYLTLQTQPVEHSPTCRTGVGPYRAVDHYQAGKHWQSNSVDDLQSITQASHKSDNLSNSTLKNSYPFYGSQVHHSAVTCKPPFGKKHQDPCSVKNPLCDPSKVQWSVPEARRLTWSPPTCRKMLGAGGSSLAALRSYHSNEQLDVPFNDHCYEDLDSVTRPPRLAPVSGKLQYNVEQAVIRPQAFRPSVDTYSSPEPPNRNLSSSYSCKTVKPDEGYASQDNNTGSHSHSASNTSSSFSHHGHPVDTSMIYSPPSHQKRSVTAHSPGIPNKLHINNKEVICHQSFSRDEDIKKFLQNKDVEIQTLRETMAHNETVIFQVYEEKRQNWAMEIRDLHDDWTVRLRMQQQKAFRTEQALTLQIVALQQDNKNLKLDCATAKAECENLSHKFEELQSETEKLRSKVEELQWELVQRKGESSHLKTQLKHSINDSTIRNNELLVLRAQLKEKSDASNNKDAEMLKLRTELQLTLKDNASLRQQLLHHKEIDASLSNTKVEAVQQLEVKECPNVNDHNASASNLSLSTSSVTLEDCHEIDELKVELIKLKTNMEKTCRQFEHERIQWLDEKNKVIRYQKHLQLNYVQMYRKNKMLESEVEQLMVELENRDLKLTSENGPIEGESTC